MATHAEMVYNNGGKLPLLGGKMGRLEKVTGRGVLKDFYMELYEFLVSNGFKDIWRVQHGANAGEWANAPHNLNRTACMFETEWLMMDKGETKEIEIRWEARSHLHDSLYGHLYFKLDLVCRRMADVETLVDGKKVVKQQGAWEFRNKFTYENKAVEKYISKLPIIKNSKKLQKFFFEFFYEKQVEEDIVHCMHHYVSHVRKLIQKHFNS